MQIKLTTNVNSIMQNKIEYVFQTLLQFLNLKEIPKEINILYNNTAEDKKDFDIYIHCDPFATEYFSKNIEFPLERIKYYSWNNESIPFLFYDELNINNLVEVTYNPLKVIINADIFSSTFFFLSHWQELVCSRRDVHNRFSANDSIQKYLNIFNIPLVNIYFEIIKEILINYFNLKDNNNRFNGKSFAIGFSHDIDYIKKWSLGIIYRETVQYLIFNSKKLGLDQRIDRFKSFIKAVLKKHDPYKISLKKILEIEQKNSVRSTFFFKAGGNSKRDVSYSLKNKYVKNLIEFLYNNNFDIGLHPSYNAYNNLRRMEKEKHNLLSLFESIQNKKSNNYGNIFGVREHFLRFSLNETPQLQEKLGFLYDSTIGFHDHEGFRASYCLPYQIYDNLNDRKMNIWEIPLVIMDGTLSDYRKLDNLDSLAKIKEIIFVIKKYNGVGVFLFHNTCYDNFDFNGWGKIFEETIDFSIKNNSFPGSLKEILDCYAKWN